MSRPGRRLAGLVPMVVTRRHSIGVFLAVVTGVVVASPSAAIADSARPTDFRSEVVAIDPPTPSIAVSIVGGDAFVLLRVDPGVEVEVMGYQSEPYLRFAADGTVYENQSSPATYINGSRYGGSSIPEGASAAAEPDWAEVAPPGSGEYAWHDHRSHLMLPTAPAGHATGRRGLHRCGADRRRRGCREHSDREHVDARPVAMAGGARCGVRGDRDRGGLRRADAPGVGAGPRRRGWDRGGDRVARLRVAPQRHRPASGVVAAAGARRGVCDRGLGARADTRVGTRLLRSPGSNWRRGRSTAGPV